MENSPRPPEIPCPKNQEGCKYKDKEGCFLSEHHYWARRTVQTPLEHRFSEDPRNKVMVCRNIHDLLDKYPSREFPSIEKMLLFLGKQAVEGDE